MDNSTEMDNNVEAMITESPEDFTQFHVPCTPNPEEDSTQFGLPCTPNPVDDSSQFAVMCTPSPLPAEPKYGLGYRTGEKSDELFDDSVDVIPASDEEMFEDSDSGNVESENVANAETRKRNLSNSNTPSRSPRSFRGRRSSSGYASSPLQRHVPKYRDEVEERSKVEEEMNDREASPKQEEYYVNNITEAPSSPQIVEESQEIITLSDDDNEQIFSQSLLEDMDRFGNKPLKKSENRSKSKINPNGIETTETSLRTETSTPLLSKNRKPFSAIDNLDITAIEKHHSNVNETIIDDTSSDENDFDDVSCGFGNLSISRKKADNRKKYGNTVTIDDSEVDVSKYSTNIKPSKTNSNDVAQFTSSGESSGGASGVTVLETKRKVSEEGHISISLDSSNSEDEESSYEASADSVNALFVSDDDSDVQEIPQKKKTAAKSSKADQGRESPVPTSSRGMNKESIKYEFKNSVQNTIVELSRIIEETPVPDDENLVPERPKNLRVDLYKHQLYGLKWLYWRENQFPGGGILADEMGLGKTLMIISLVLKSKEEKKRSQPEEPEWNSQEKNRNKLVPSQSTLVVCPAGMLKQWETEISSKARNMTVVCFHGPKRKTSAAVLAQHDFVLTTYQTLGSEIPKDVHSRSPLSKIHWERVVLDEGHIIRNNKTIAAHGVCTLQANYRWVVTGTPVHNSAQDMFSLVSFLRMTPFSDKKVWEFWIGFKGMTSDQSNRLHTIGNSLLLRRTKEEVNLGDPTRQIPPKVVRDKEVTLSEQERLIYDHLKEFAAERFKDFLKDKEQRDNEIQHAADQYTAGGRRGRERKMSDVNFSSLFALLLRLRQASVLPYLIHTMLEEDEENKSLDTSEMEEEIISIKNPTFKMSFKSAKIVQLLEDINKLRDEADAKGEHMDKVIVISQWVTLLDIIHRHLTKDGYSVVDITGKVSLDERTEAMKKLNSQRRTPQVMCLSLGAGGVGLNLIGANHVFFMDIHWNPQLELQAQDRVHRFGQTKNVTVTRYISKDTVDERVIVMQNGKLELAEGILSNTKKTRGGGLSIGQMRTLFDL